MSQRASQKGSGNVAVLVNGANNTVTVKAGEARLTLLQRHRIAGHPRKLLDFLDPFRCPVAVLGREQELGRLEAWLASDRRIAVQVLIGQGGAGKTRLSLELCHRAERLGWHAGFVPHGELERFEREMHLANWAWPDQLLTVVDYAASSAQILRTWLQQLAQSPQGKPKLRLLLLERHADPDFGWWADVTRRESWSDAAEEVLDPPWPVMLPLLEGAQTWRSIFRAFVDKVASFRQCAVPADLDEWLGAHATALENADPLQILMAGVVLIEEEGAAALGRERLDLARALAAVELGRLNKLARDRGISEGFFKRLIVAVNLQQGGDSEEIARLVEEEAVAGKQVVVHGIDHLVHALQDALPSQELGSVDAVRPDLVGEAVILQAVAELRMSTSQQAGLVERAWRRSGSSVIATLVRMAQDYGGRDRKHQSLVWLHGVTSIADDPIILRNIAGELPSETVVLRELAVELESRIGTALSDRAHTDSNLRPALALAFSNLNARLRAVRQLEQGSTAGQKAVDLARELASKDYDKYRPLLATALNNLANTVYELGQRKRALGLAREAVAIKRELYSQDATLYAPDLAMSLVNLGAMLDAREDDEALIVEQDAVSLLRTLSAEQPEALQPYLALSLRNLSHLLGRLGRDDEALQAGYESLHLYRVLARQVPDAFRPDLAAALRNLSILLSELGQVRSNEQALDFEKKALDLAEEVVAIHRDLFAQRRETFRIDLAESLAAQARRLSALGQYDQATMVVSEALAVCHDAPVNQLETSRAAIANVLDNLATIHHRNGHHAEALAALKKAGELYRDLATTRPEQFQLSLAKSLVNVSVSLAKLERPEEALAVAEEAVASLHQLVEERPTALPELAVSLAQLAEGRDAVGDHEGALAANVEALTSLSEPFRQQPSQHVLSLSRIASAYFDRCAALRQFPDPELLRNFLSEDQVASLFSQ